MKKFYFMSNGKRLCGVIRKRQKSSMILVIHGFTSNKNGRTMKYIGSRLANQNYALMGIDLFGHGESEGNIQEVTIPIGVKNVVDAAEYAQKLGYKKIILLGSSFGGLCSMLAAPKIKPEAIILRSPVSTYVGRKEALKNKGKNFKKLYKKYTSYKVAAKISCPTIIFHGTEDEIVNIQQSRKLSKILKHGKLVEIPTGGHDFTIAQMKYIVKASKNFLKQTVN